MTETTQSVVTPERYRSGKTFEQYLASGIRTRELFEDNYKGTIIPPEKIRRLKELAARPGGPDHVMVVGEDWCPDVYRGAPVAARIAEAMGVEYRFFERDQNKDIMAEFLNGEFESIPVIVIYDREGRVLGRLTERPKLAHEQIHLTREVLGDMSPQGVAARLGHEPSEEELAAARSEARARYMDWQKGPVWAGWRDATVDEIIELLS